MPDSDLAAPAGWGAWTFNPGALTLDLLRNGLPAHSIQLRAITSSACMLEAIFELKSRPWADNGVLGDLITAFQDLFDPRVNLCGGGRDRSFDPLVHFRNGRVQ